MARTQINRFLVVFFSCFILLLIFNGIEGKSLQEFNRRNDQYARDYPNTWPRFRRSQSLMKTSRSLTRSVIPPRICYLARILGSSGQQKICLPYNDR